MKSGACWPTGSPGGVKTGSAKPRKPASKSVKESNGLMFISLLRLILCVTFNSNQFETRKRPPQSKHSRGNHQQPVRARFGDGTDVNVEVVAGVRCVITGGPGTRFITHYVVEWYLLAYLIWIK